MSVYDKRHDYSIGMKHARERYPSSVPWYLFPDVGPGEGSFIAGYMLGRGVNPILLQRYLEDNENPLV